MLSPSSVSYVCQGEFSDMGCSNRSKTSRFSFVFTFIVFMNLVSVD